MKNILKIVIAIVLYTAILTAFLILGDIILSKSVYKFSINGSENYRVRNNWRGYFVILLFTDLISISLFHFLIRYIGIHLRPFVLSITSSFIFLAINSFLFTLIWKILTDIFLVKTFITIGILSFFYPNLYNFLFHRKEHIKIKK